jgi:thioredoxin-dependent peroxiredoxin
MLKAGETAPDFHALSTTGDYVSLRALRGKKVILYFYPKAFTPGCTAEARRFRDNYDELRAYGAEVIGVSVDQHGTQCRFAARHELRFPLVADHDKAISKAYGVLWPGLPLDKRVTFVIDEEGTIAAVFRHEFQVTKHLDDVTRFLQKANG